MEESEKNSNIKRDNLNKESETTFSCGIGEGNYGVSQPVSGNSGANGYQAIKTKLDKSINDAYVAWGRS